MPFKRTVLPNGLVLIDSYDITPEEELAKLSEIRLRHRQAIENAEEKRERAEAAKAQEAKVQTPAGPALTKQPESRKRKR